MKSGENIIGKNVAYHLNKQNAEIAFEDFLKYLGFNYPSDPQMKDTPRRVVKMYMEELFIGCYTEAPKITVFPNTREYDEMIFEGDIKLNSICSHHFVPFIGVCHIAYIPSVSGNITGLSKLNRIVEWYARRPQIQEELTTQIHDYIEELLKPKGVAVYIQAEHLCVKIRGVKHDSTMITSKLSGVFKDNSNLARKEFYDFINNLKK